MVFRGFNKKLKRQHFKLFGYVAARGGTCAFTLQMVKSLIKTSRDDRPQIST